MNDTDPPDDQTQRGRGRPRLRRASPLIVALVGLAFTAAACSSGSSSPGVASVGSTTTTTTASAGASPAGNSGTSTAGALKFAQCMRSRGISQFPDPNTQGGFDAVAGVNPNSSQYLAAQKTCQPLVGSGLPPAKQAQMQAKLLKFAQCMRTHGVPNYPDPIFSNGGVSQAIGKESGLSPNSPTFQAAQKACQSVHSGSGS
jgi:hypothetical protein